jgi:diguanylate cyclase (GGDEF)-like protein
MKAPADEEGEGRLTATGRLGRGELEHRQLLAEEEITRERLQALANTIQRFSALDFSARAPVGSGGDLIDAVAAGINFLGEELQASYGELEQRVSERTAELLAATEELGHRALHDELTGLANRALIWDRLTHRLDLAERRQSGFAVLFIDLDDFKRVNDEFGHAAGDRLLVDVAARIRGELRSGDSAARIGGDEFLILFDDISSSNEALAVARRLSDVLRAPFEMSGGQEEVASSIGVAMGPNGFATADEVVAASDQAMYEAKRRKHGGVVLFGLEEESLG